MAVLLVVLTLLHVFQASNEARSRHQRIVRGGSNEFSWEKPQSSLFILDLNKYINGRQPQYNWNSIFNLGSLLPYVLDDTNGEETQQQGAENDSTYCNVIANDKNIDIIQLVNLFQMPEPSSSPLRTSNAVLLCERNCTQMAFKMCPSCIEATLNILSYTCRRKCQLTEGQKEFLHDQSVHPGPEYMCKKKKEEHARCCKGNCYRSIFKQCWFKKTRLCTVETVRVLKTSCDSKCERGSSNPYLNAFCSFVFKYKKKRTAHILMNMSSTYFWEKVITPYPLRK